MSSTPRRPPRGRQSVLPIRTRAARRDQPDGRTDATAALGDRLEAAEYELVFSVGEHFGGAAFLRDVPVRFTVTEPGAHHHVPLLASPWSYSTYRGS